MTNAPMVEIAQTMALEVNSKNTSRAKQAFNRSLNHNARQAAALQRMRRPC